MKIYGGDMTDQSSQMKIYGGESETKGDALNKLTIGGLITTKKCYFVDLIIMVLSTFEQ